MTMSMCGPGLTTTRYNRKQKPSKSKKLAKAQHNNKIPDYSSKDTVKLSNKVAGHGSAKERNVYSGERQLLGIATMHKSNMVPIFADKKEDAKDIASMRR